MNETKNIAINIRRGADRHDFIFCEQQIMVLFDKVDRYKTLSVILEQLRQYQPIFSQSHDDIIWIPEALHLLEASASPEQIKPLLRWEEFEKWDQNAYFSSVEKLYWVYFELHDENSTKAREWLLGSLQAIMNAHRYNFWSKQYPHLEQFWDLEDNNLNGMLAGLSFGRDPIVQAFMRDKWNGIASQIEAWD